MNRYINNPITAPSGHPNTCWRAVKLDADLEVGTVTLTYLGWKDGQAYADKKVPTDSRVLTFNVSDITSYDTLFTELAGLTLMSPEFLGGAIDVIPEPSV